MSVDATLMGVFPCMIKEEFGKLFCVLFTAKSVVFAVKDRKGAVR